MSEEISPLSYQTLTISNNNKIDTFCCHYYKSIQLIILIQKIFTSKKLHKTGNDSYSNVYISLHCVYIALYFTIHHTPYMHMYERHFMSNEKTKTSMHEN